MSPEWWASSRNDPRVLGWDVWNEPDNPSKDYRKVENADKLALVEAFLPHVFQWVRAVNPVQPLTSGVWQGHWKDPGSRSAIASLQLELSDVISFHSYGDPSEFEARIDELTPLGRPIICTEYLARNLGSTVEGILPVAKRRHVGAYNWGFVAGRDADVSAVGFLAAAVHHAPGGVVQRSHPPRRAGP